MKFLLLFLLSFNVFAFDVVQNANAPTQLDWE